jgi:hypothetical protein
MFEVEPREKVRLYLRHFKEKPWQFDDPPRQPDPGLKIRPTQIIGRFGLFDLPADTRRFWCLVDTGAMLTLLPREVWEPYQAHIRWLHVTAGPWNATKISGQSLSLQLGLVTMRFLDYDKGMLSRQIIAGCVTEAHGLKQAVLGLGGGQAIAGGGLCLNVVEDSLWLVTV